MRFSRKTLVRLSEAMPNAFSHAQLTTVVYEYGTDAADNLGANLLSRSLRLLRALEASPQEDVAEQSVREIIERVLENPDRRRHSPALVASLEVDGFEFRDHRLVATTPGPAALAPEISALEADMQSRGFAVAAQHYRQAVDNFTDGNFEAANGQLRAAFEDFVPRVCAALLNTNPDNPTAALQQLRNANRLDNAEFHTFKSFWDGIQDNGPHAGLTSPDEALYRLHSGTAIARYLLKKQ